MILTPIFIWTGCTKDKPAPGRYRATFIYEMPTELAKYTDGIEISDPSENSISINGSILSKNGKKIEGEIISLPGVGSYIHIDGEWSKKFLQSEYKISGAFTQRYSQHGGEFQSSGHFEIISD